MPKDIPARKARIQWNDNGDVLVDEIGDDSHPELTKSGGAVWAFWKKATPEGLYFRLLQQAHMLTVEHGIDPQKVHDAFKVIPEYRSIMGPSDEEEPPVELPVPDFGEGYPL